MPDAEDRTHVGSEVDELGDRRIARGAAPDLRDPAQLRADQEGVDPARRGAEVRVVQDHPAQAPVVRVAVPLDPLVVDVEVRRLRLAEEGGDLGGRQRRPCPGCRRTRRPASR